MDLSMYSTCVLSWFSRGQCVGAVPEECGWDAVSLRPAQNQVGRGQCGLSVEETTARIHQYYTGTAVSLECVCGGEYLHDIFVWVK